MIPFFKLPLDLCSYNFSKWVFTHGVNPLHCEKGTRTLSLFASTDVINDWPLSMQFSVLGKMTFTIADIVALLMSPSFLKTFALLFMLISIFFLIKKITLHYRSITALDSLARVSLPVCRKVHNPYLIACLKKCGLQIVISPNLAGSPFIVGLTSFTVYFPGHIFKNLSIKEYEAILAHEIEHIRHKDNLVRLSLDFIGSIFWWIPTKWLLNRIEQGQEVACDFKCKKYGVSSLDLASAICKSARNPNKHTHPFQVAHYLTKHIIHKRLNILLYPAVPFKKIYFIFSFLAIATSLLIFLGKYWSF